MAVFLAQNVLVVKTHSILKNVLHVNFFSGSNTLGIHLPVTINLHYQCFSFKVQFE